MLTPTAYAAIDSPEALDAARNYAMGLIENGQRLEAATYLLQTLRDIPRDRADLALPAIGAVQLLMFDNEYLMFDAEREALYAGVLDEENSEMGRFLATLMRYMDDAGITQEEANQCAMDITKLARCAHLPVRLGALFVMASPYYFYDTKLAQNARDDIIREFPDNFLAEEAQRLTLYTARWKGVDGLRHALEAKNDDGTLRSHSLRVQADPVGRALKDALQPVDPEQARAACVAGLADVASETTDWAEEYAALNILEGFHETQEAPAVRAAASAAIARNTDARTVFRARMLRLSIARNDADVAGMLDDANALLMTNPIPVVPERNN